MKIRHFMIALPLAASLFMVGCGASNEEVQKLKDQNTELSAAQKKDSLYIASMNKEMDELYANLDSMRAREERIRQATEKLRAKTMSGKEGSVTIDESFAQLEKLLAQNKQKIASLQKKLADSDKKNAELQRFVDELQKSITDKDNTINDLKTQVTSLQKEVEDLKVVNATIVAQKEEREKELTATTDQLNAVYYVVGTKKELEKKGVVDTRGLFNKLDGIAAGANEGAFVKGDKRYLKEINAGAGKAKNTTVIPKREGYEVIQNGGDVIIKITDPEKFWKQKMVAVVM